MLRVTVELVPMGNEAAKRTLSVMHISNTGEDNADAAHYNCTQMYDYTNVPSRFKRTSLVTRDSNVFLFLHGLLNELFKEQ